MFCHACIYIHNYVNFHSIWIQIFLISSPPKQKKRGRPKGSDLTVIGLPNKKRKGNGPVPFIKKHPKEKEKSK